MTFAHANSTLQLMWREELWVVKARDWTMKEMLLQMLERRAVATLGDVELVVMEQVCTVSPEDLAIIVDSAAWSLDAADWRRPCH